VFLAVGGPKLEDNVASTHDDIFGKYKLYSGIAIGGVLLALVLDSCSGPDDETMAETGDPAAPVAQTAAVDSNSVEKNLEPVEKLAVVDKSAPPAAARSGEAVYQAACIACHAAGVLNAPKLEPGAWDERIAKGIDGLTHSAINGLNAMPPRGGNPDVTDEEITAAINYMLSTSGYELAAADSASTTATQADSTDASATDAKAAAPQAPQPVAAMQEAPAKPEAPVAPQAPEQNAAQQMAQTDTGGQKYLKEGALGQQVYQNTCFTCHDVGVAQAPVIGDSAAWQQRAGAGLDALYNSALNGKGLMPPKAGNASLSREQVIAAVDYMLATAGVSAAAAAPAAEQAQTESAPATQQAAAEAAAAETPAAPAAEAAPAAVQATIDGEKIYRGLCFSCHDGGIAGAPKLGDKAAWEPRIATGLDALHNSTLNGKGVMPAKGGNPALSDDEIRAAVDWMVQQSQ
jgi:cytochrome c5